MRKCGAYDCEASVWSIHIEQIGRFTHSVNIENINNCIAKLNVFSLSLNFFKALYSAIIIATAVGIPLIDILRNRL